MTVLAGAGLLAGHALADTVPIPSVPTVTVPTPPVAVPTPPVAVPKPPVAVVPKPPVAVVPKPPVAVPLPTIPKLPPPVLPAPSPVQPPSSTPAVPAVPAVSAIAGSTPGGGSTVGGGSTLTGSSTPGGSSTLGGGSTLAGNLTLGGGSASSGSSAAAIGPGSDRKRVERFHSSRRWITTNGPKSRRVTTLTFLLPHAARVLFVVKQVSPVCRIAGHFAVNGHAGRNRVRFPGRTSKLQLDPGTYLITARTRGGHVVQRVTIVVVDGGAPTRDQIIAARAANVCTAAERLAAAASGSTGASNTSNGSPQRSFTPGQPSVSGSSEGGKSHSGAVLASSVERAAQAARPVLVALLALAVLLLAIASLPRLAVPDARTNELIARHRMEIAGLGTAAFVAVVVAFLFG